MCYGPRIILIYFELLVYEVISFPLNFSGNRLIDTSSQLYFLGESKSSQGDN